jgi:hypothetical protein
MVLTDFSTRETSAVLSSVSTAVVRTVVEEAELTLLREGVAACLQEECDLRPEKDANGVESETRSEEGEELKITVLEPL